MLFVWFGVFWGGVFGLFYIAVSSKALTLHGALLTLAIEHDCEFCL